MYPEIRLIGTIQAMEEPIQGKPDRVITVVANLQNGQKGSFRVRILSGDATHYMVGDDILVQGNLDEVGTIHPNHGGILRKLAPAIIPPVLRPLNSATTQTQAEAVASRDDADAPVPPRAPQSNATHPFRAATPFPKPAAAQNARPPFGSLFNAGRGPAPKPAATPAETARPREASRATHGATGSTDTPPSKAFASARRDRAPASSGISSDNAAPNRGSPRQSWDIEPPAQAAPPARKPKSELAEYLQDEIPW